MLLIMKFKILNLFSLLIKGKGEIAMKIIEHHWQYMYRSMYFRESVIMSVI